MVYFYIKKILLFKSNKKSLGQPDLSVLQDFEKEVTVVGSYLHATVSFSAQAMHMLYGFACLEEASRLFLAQDWGIVRAGSGEKHQRCASISTGSCPPRDFAPDPRFSSQCV